MTPRKPNRICEVTHKPCEWKFEDFYDDDGNIESSDKYCIHCGKWQDQDQPEDFVYVR